MTRNKENTTGIEESKLGYLKPAKIEDMDAIIALATKAYPAKVVNGVRQSLKFYKDALQAGLDDGRRFFKREENGQIVGVCGFQRRPEDPPGVCWGSWFFIDPEKRGSTLAFRMAEAFLNTVKHLGYKTIYTETSVNHQDYYNIADYFERYGFSLVASLPNFYEPGVDGQIYKLDLLKNEEVFSKTSLFQGR